LRVVRAETLVNRRRSILEGSHPAAEAGNSAIIVSSAFFAFNKRMQVRTIIHELVHEADYQGHLSSSPEWILMDEAHIQAVRYALDVNSRQGLQPLFDYGARSLGLPTVYAAENSAESLAEWTTSYVEGQALPAKIKAFIEGKILNPNCAEEPLDRKMIAARDALRKGDFRSSMDLLSDIINKDPHFLSAYQFLTDDYLGMHDLKRALACSKRLMDEADKLGEARYEIASYDIYCYQRSNVFYTAGNLPESVRYLSEALKIAPDFPMYLTAKKVLEEAKKKREHAHKL
jgi:tetratricopeptide (TPR) repeat protein